jgi:hypothetical protein
MRTIAAMKDEQTNARQELITLLQCNRMLSTKDVVERSTIEPDLLRLVVWSLIEEGAIEFTPDRKIRLAQ